MIFFKVANIFILFQVGIQRSNCQNRFDYRLWNMDPTNWPRVYLNGLWRRLFYLVSLCLWKEALLNELFCNLDCVGCCSLAEVVSHTPEVEAGFH